MTNRRTRAARRARQSSLEKALRPNIQPAATFTPEQAIALARALQSGPSVLGSQPLPRDPAWATVPFGPGMPLIPQGVNVVPPGRRQAEPRQFEFPVSWNLPGFTDRLIPWAILRNAADIPLFRQCIETRKAEAVTKPWDIRVSQNAIRRAQQKDPGANINDIKKALQAKVDPHIGRLIDFWSEPDRWNGRDFTAWCTMALEEILVLDALPIFPRRTRGGDLYGLEILDGTTIKPLLDDYGRRPLPPNPAYQQILYGFPRGEYISDVDLDPEVAGQQPERDAYTVDQLIYHVTHTRTHTPYGHSAVERALQDGDLWMRRHGWLKAEYTDGVMPSGWLEAGEGQAEWTPSQLEVYEKAFNDYYAGATASRQRFRILPWGMKPSQSTDLGEKYKPDYDLFLLKLVVRHFDTNIQELGFNEARGLGSAGMHEHQERLQDRTATQPTLDRLGKLCTRLQIRFLDAPPELEFVFPGDEEEDAAKEDEMWGLRVSQGRATRNEDRDRQGQPRFEFPEADMPAIQTATGLLFVEGASHAAAPGQVLGPGAPPGMEGPPEPGEADGGPPGGPGGTSGGPGGGGGAQPGPTANQTAQQGGPPGLTKADLDWLDEMGALARPGATATARAELVLSKADLTDDQARELAVYQRWRKRGRTTGHQFQFRHLTAEQQVHLPTLLKEDSPPDPPPAQPARQWPGWAMDAAIAAAGADAILGALTGSGIIEAILQQARRQFGDTAPDQPTVLHWLHDTGVVDTLAQALAPVVRNLYTEGYALGSESARSLVEGDRAATWTPGDWRAASRLLTTEQGGVGPGLQAMLDQADIVIHSIAANQVDALAQVLAAGLNDMKNTEQIAADVQQFGMSRDRAQMIAHTEVARAQGWAAMDRYEAMGVPGTEWLVAPDQRVCKICAANAAAGTVPLGQPYPSGDMFPPGHPRCRCVPAPVLVDLDKADAPTGAPAMGWEEDKHPRAAGGKFGQGAGPGTPLGPPPVSVADVHAMQTSHLSGSAAAKQRHQQVMKLVQERQALQQQQQHQRVVMQTNAKAAAQAKQAAALEKATLKQGSTGPKVGSLQHLLNSLGIQPPLEKDGVYGPKTLAAVKQAQARLGLKPDGRVTPAQMKLLRSLKTLPPVQKADVGVGDLDWLPGIGLQDRIDILYKAWDPALHPRDPFGRFISVGVRRPRKRGGWGRSKAEIDAWEAAHRVGEGTRLVDAGRAGARGVGHARVANPADHVGVHRALSIKPGLEPVADAHWALDEAKGDPQRVIDVIDRLNLEQLRKIADGRGMKWHEGDTEQGLKELILHHEVRAAVAQRQMDRGGIGFNEAVGFGVMAADQAVQEWAARRLRGKAQTHHDPIRPQDPVLAAHAALDAARGDRVKVAAALQGLKKPDLQRLMDKRVGWFDRKDRRVDLEAQLVHNEAYRYALEDGRQIGLAEQDARERAWAIAKGAADAHREQGREESLLRYQRNARRRHQAQQRQGRRVAPDGQIHHPAPAVQQEHVLRHGDASEQIAQGQARLREQLRIGERSRTNPDVEGAIGITSVVTYNDGSHAISKMDDGYDGEAHTDAEELSNHLALHMGLQASATIRDPDSPMDTVLMTFAEGYEVAGRRHFTSDQMARIAASPTGRRIGLFDVMTGQIDRHGNNWMIRKPEGKTLAEEFADPDIHLIDHGFTFTDPRLETGLTGAGVFYTGIGIYGHFSHSNSYSLEEIDNARLALQRMRPEFERLKRMDWYQTAMARLGEVARRSSDQRVQEILPQLRAAA